MKKARRKKADKRRPSYQREDFPKGLVRGKYAARLAKGSNIVRLDPKIHAAFPTSEAVNEALSGLLQVAKATSPTRRASGRSKTRATER